MTSKENLMNLLNAYGRMPTPFQTRVYRACSQIPKGKVTTYKLLAEALGIKSSQAIGQALKRNPYAPEVPCHRVVASDGTIGGFMGKVDGAEIAKKIRLLESEGVVLDGNKVKDFERVVTRLREGVS
jgi:methylated-DNA-[protein]-cysteine S-methyltransferase